MKAILKKFFLALVAAGMFGLSVYLCEWAFKEVLGFRILERIPHSLIAESVGGETQVVGIAEAGEPLLKAPKTGTRSIYYRYLLEREETDSDGDKSWRTERDETRSTNFSLVDNTGRVNVLARSYDWRVEWSIERKYRHESGRYRHTEWRIDPGDELTIFGWLELGTIPEILFSDRGQYLPIISSFSAAEERADIALEAILLLWGGVSALLIAGLALVYVLRIHRTLIFLGIISASGCILLFQYGIRSAEADVSGGYDRVTDHRQRVEQLISEVLGRHDIGSPGLGYPMDLNSALYLDLSSEEKSQIEAWRLGAFQVRERFINQVDRFPERYLAASSGRGLPPVVTIPAGMLSKAGSIDDGYQQTRTMQSLLWVVLLLVVAVLATWFSFKAIRTKRMQENIPTSKTGGVVFGLAEVEGELVPEDRDKLLVGPLTAERCCWYHYVVEEKRGSGKNASWHVIEDKIGKQPFLCRDEEGEIRVFPTKAECLTKHVTKSSEGNKKYREERLMPGDDLYILGKAKLDKTRGDTLVFAHEKDSPFIVANIPEEQVMLQKAMKGMAAMTISLSVLFLSALFVTGSEGQLSSLDFLLASLIAPVFMMLVVVMLMYNDLVFLRERCARNWANIQVSLKKRADLVPQIERVVKQYLSHEAELQTMLVKLREQRSTLNAASDVDNYLALEHESISGIRAAVEAYPDLEGIDLIAVLNRRLIKLENEVGLIRSGFNDAVTEYAIRCQRFPDLILARMFGFKAIDLLAFETDAHKVPPVVTPVRSSRST